LHLRAEIAAAQEKVFKCTHDAGKEMKLVKAERIHKDGKKQFSEIAPIGRPEGTALTHENGREREENIQDISEEEYEQYLSDLGNAKEQAVG